MVDCGVANFVLPGQRESGDLHLVTGTEGRVLIAAIDVWVTGKAPPTQQRRQDPFSRNAQMNRLSPSCDVATRRTRGVVLSLAAIDTSHGVMTWLGVGNVRVV